MKSTFAGSAWALGSAVVVMLFSVNACATPGTPAAPATPAATPAPVATAAVTRAVVSAALATGAARTTPAPGVVVATRRFECPAILSVAEVQSVLGGTAALQPVTAAAAAALATSRPEALGTCAFVMRGATARAVTVVVNSMSIARANNPNYDPFQSAPGGAGATRALDDVPGLGDSSKWFTTSAAPGTGLLITYRGDFGIVVSVIDGTQANAIALMRVILPRIV